MSFIARIEFERRIRDLLSSGRPSFLQLEGEPGSGKTRLVHDLGGERRFGYVRENGLPPLGPFAHLVRSGRETLLPLQNLSLGLDGRSAERWIEPSRMLVEVRHAWVSWARSLAARGPALLVLENVQWADRATVDLLEHFAARVKDRPLSVIATCRPGTPLLAGFERWTYPLLDPDGARDYVTHHLGRAAPKAWMDALFRQSRGNPGHLEEAARVLQEAVDPALVPDRYYDLLVRRIESLEPRDLEVVEWASVAGSVFSGVELSAAMGRDVREDLARSPLYFAVNDEEFAFRSPLLREASYSILTPKNRVRAHEALAAASRARAGAAWHWRAAGRADRATELFRDEAEEALRRSCFLHAIEYAPDGPLRARALAGLGRYDDALAAGPDPAWAADLHERREDFPRMLAEARTDRQRAVALARLGRYDEALRAAASALASSRDPATISSAAVVHGLVGDYEQALKLHEEALAGWRRAGDLRGVQQEWIHLARVRRSLGDPRASAEAFELALRVAREIGGLHAIASILQSLGGLRHFVGEYDAANAAYTEALSIWRELGDRRGWAQSWAGIGAIYAERGQYFTSLGFYREALEALREIGDLGALASTLGSMGTVHLERGEYEPARECLEDALRIVREIGGPWTQALVVIRLGRLYGDTGRVADAERMFREGIAVSRTVETPIFLAEALRARARMRLAAGDPRGKADAEEAVEVARELGNPFELAEALSTLARYASGERAAKLVEEARALAHPAGNFRAFLTTVEDEASVRLAAGDREGAVECARRGLHRASAQGATPAEKRLRALIGE